MLNSRCPGAEDGWLPGQRLTKISFKKSVEFDDDFDSFCDEGTVWVQSDPVQPPEAFDYTNIVTIVLKVIPHKLDNCTKPHSLTAANTISATRVHNLALLELKHCIDYFTIYQICLTVTNSV